MLIFIFERIHFAVDPSFYCRVVGAKAFCFLLFRRFFDDGHGNANTCCIFQAVHLLFLVFDPPCSFLTYSNICGGALASKLIILFIFPFLQYGQASTS